jgi:hypothetical protein
MIQMQEFGQGCAGVSAIADVSRLVLGRNRRAAFRAFIASFMSAEVTVLHDF